MRPFVLALLASSALIACSPSNTTDTQGNAPTAPAVSEQSASERLNAWFEVKYEEQVARSPEAQTFLGRDTNQDKLDRYTAESDAEDLEWLRQAAAEMKSTFAYDDLDEETKTSYDVFLFLLDQAEAAEPFSENGYVFEQMGAVQGSFPQLLIAFHVTETEEDMQNYIARITETGRALNELIVRSKANAAAGNRPPKFAFEAVIEESTNIITGTPFDDSGVDSDIWTDINSKLDALTQSGAIDEARADSLRGEARTALLGDWLSAYQDLIAWQREDMPNASTVGTGVGTLQSNGAAYYNQRLADQTTTSLTADEIHEIGLSEVARLRAEMDDIREEVGFEGDLRAFFDFLRDTKDDERLYFPNTDEGRQGYIDDATAVIDKMKTQLPNYFGHLPKADLVVKRVEAFREQDGAAQHYFPSTPDGSRPGTYYAHLSDMTAMPKRELEVIAYHEGLPGHHMQIAIAQELEGLPTFRTQLGFTAYVEGWALYSELLAAEIPGTYPDPYSRFGRLGSEIWRAIRLVVDTGLHSKGWTEQQAVDYFLANAAITEPQALSEVRRYIVWPGQATSYKIGMLKILELRAKAEAELGANFDIRAFHDTILGGGALPLSVLEKRVERWIEAVKAG
jgi:uncharacterized protein (DUF885 family)